MKFSGGITLVWGELTFGVKTKLHSSLYKALQAFTHCFAVSEWRGEPAKTAVSPRSSPLRTKINVYIINPVVMGFPMQNLFNFTFLLVDFGKVLCLSANDLQQNSNSSSREEYIPQILTVLLEIHRVYICPL